MRPFSSAKNSQLCQNVKSLSKAKKTKQNKTKKRKPKVSFVKKTTLAAL